MTADPAPPETCSSARSSRRVALVTGGTRGLGRAIVLALAERGLDVAFTYASRLDLAQEVGREVEARGVSGHFAQLDAQSGDDASVIRSLEDRYGRLDTVVMNAGIWKGGLISDIDPLDWWDVVQTNLGGPYRLARAAAPMVAKSPAGSLTLVSSIIGVTGFPGDTAYASSKAALTGLGRSLAKELARTGTRVNILAPGFVESDLTAGIPEVGREAMLRRTVMRRFGDPGEIAKAAVFLSEDATYTTGAVLTVDGGFSL